MMSNLDYRCWKEFNLRSTSESLTLDYLRKHKAELGLTEVRSCLSISPGSGGLDCKLVRHCMPKLWRYFALEPSRQCLQQLKEAMARERQRRRGGMEIRLKLQRVQTWPGPRERIDFILMSSVLSCLNQEERLMLLRQCHNWLSSKGLLFILVVQPCQLLIDMLVKHCGLKTDDILNSQGIREDLETTGLLLNVKEHKIELGLDVSNCTLALLSYLLNKRASNQDLYHFQSHIKEVYPDQKVPCDNYLFVYKRP